MRIDFTLTLPGLLEVESIQALADQLGVDVLAKVIFSFSPDIVMSPLALPRELLDNQINRLLGQLPSGALADMLTQLKSRPTFAEQWPDQWEHGLVYGKRRMLRLEKIRNTDYGLDKIYEQDTEIDKWWKAIRTDQN